MTNEPAPAPTMEDPPHHSLDAPCAWCGAVWTKDPAPLNSSTMLHADGCAYIAWVNET